MNIYNGHGVRLCPSSARSTHFGPVIFSSGADKVSKRPPQTSTTYRSISTGSVQTSRKKLQSLSWLPSTSRTNKWNGAFARKIDRSLCAALPRVTSGRPGEINRKTRAENRPLAARFAKNIKSSIPPRLLFHRVARLCTRGGEQRRNEG